MLFKRENPNKILIEQLEQQESNYSILFAERSNDETHITRDHIWNYYNRIRNARHLLENYNKFRYFSYSIKISDAISGDNKYLNLDNVLNEIEKLKNSNLYSTPVTHLNIAFYLSITSLALGLASSIIAFSIKSHIYSTMNPWLAFGTIVMPLIIAGLILILSGCFGIFKTIEDKKSWSWNITKRSNINYPETTFADVERELSFVDPTSMLSNNP